MRARTLKTFLHFAAGFFVLKLLGFQTFYSFDSFHYLKLSLDPVWGESHPLGFGFFLRGLTWVMSTIGLERWASDVFFAFQWGIAWTYLNLAWPREALKKIRIPLAQKCAVLLFVALSVPALLYLSMAVWTEMISMAALMLLAVHLRSVVRQKSSGKRLLWKPFVLGWVGVPVWILGFAPQFRFQWVGLIGVWAGFSLYSFARARSRAGLRLMSQTIGGVLVIFFISIVGTRLFPRSPIAARHTLGQWAVSVQCQVGCSRSLFENVCRLDSVRHALESGNCSEVLLQHAPLGTPKFESVSSVIDNVGVWNIIRWAIEAPIRFLRDQHRCWGLEIETFDFLHASGAKAFPSVLETFRAGWTHPDPDPSIALKAVLKWIEFLHFKLKIFNLLTVLVVAAGFYRWFRMRDVEVGYWVAVGTLSWLIFAYFNPHTPLRFLLQILLPAWLAIVVTTDQKRGSQPEQKS